MERLREEQTKVINLIEEEKQSQIRAQASEERDAERVQQLEHELMNLQAQGQADARDQFERHQESSRRSE